MITALFRPVFVYMAGIAIAIVAAELWLHVHDAKVRASVVQEINRQAEKISEDAIAARTPAERPGAWQRLRDNNCTNCKAGLPKGDPTCVH